MDFALFFLLSPCSHRYAIELSLSEAVNLIFHFRSKIDRVKNEYKRKEIEVKPPKHKTCPCIRNSGSGKSSFNGISTNRKMKNKINQNERVKEKNPFLFDF